MAEQQSKETGYERLGEKKLTLVDAVAQSVGAMGPVFSAAFVIPAVIGANAAAKGAGIAAPLAVLLAGVGVFALGWIVAQYAKRIHAAGALYDYVSNGLGNTVGAVAGWLYYGGSIILTVGLGVLIGGYVHDIMLPTLGIDSGLLPIWLWDVIWGVVLFCVLHFGVQISTRVQLVLSRASFDFLSGWLETSHEYVFPNGAKRSFASKIRVYSATELAATLGNVGFNEIRLFGGLDQKPFDWGSRLVVIAKR